MAKELTATELVNLQKELNDIMMDAKPSDNQTTIKNRYKIAGEILVQLNLLDSAHKDTPEIVARTYAYFTKEKIKNIVSKSQ